MLPKQLVIREASLNQLLVGLDNRDTALWLQFDDLADPKRMDLVPFLTLPWRLVLTEGNGPKFAAALEATNSSSDGLVRRRGFIHVVDTDPSRIELPTRCLPIYLLDGRDGPERQPSFGAKLRRLTMLEELRRSGVRQLIIMTPSGKIPNELKDIWREGFRASLTVISDSPEAESNIVDWLGGLNGISAANLVEKSLHTTAEEVTWRFLAEFPEDRRVVRFRDLQGAKSLLDVTDLDEPERPILAQYSIVQERDLSAITPDDLTADDLTGFFRDSTTSWKPYSAGLPWIRDAQVLRSVKAILNKLDSVGSSENSVAYISSDAGAGGTTLARAIAWECARDGYPTLIANQLPFDPDALPLSNFLNRISEANRAKSQKETLARSGAPESAHGARRYEAPWVIVFDVVHWRSKESELVRFRNELVKAGRPVLVLVVSGSITPLPFYNKSIFRKIAELNHEITKIEAEALGGHLNKFLKKLGKSREASEWERFYNNHSVNLVEGSAAFWLSLSFWIQGQYDLSESIQEWMYRCFKSSVAKELMPAVLQIAALSAERVPMPEALLPKTEGKWPISHLLEDARSDLTPLGLTSTSSNGKKYWALLHDILGRFLINAFFYDYDLRRGLGFGDVQNSEHLRFRLLQDVSRNSILGEKEFHAIGEEFSTSLFKIDPDHGRASFAPYWREVLGALDEMPQSLHTSSRVFNHHIAISRRRIAKLDGALYNISIEDRVNLLSDAVKDLTYAIERIEYKAGAESDLHLYNSLANAYLDLANAESDAGASQARVAELRELANVATRKAYEESPTNSFVLETYVKNLLENARTPSPDSISSCVEALGILFSALTSDDSMYRKAQLSELANLALGLLLGNAPPRSGQTEFSSPVDVLIAAWRELASEDGGAKGIAFSEVSHDARVRALEVLQSPAGRGNLQVIHLTYDLVSITMPKDFAAQMELLEQLVSSRARTSPQLRLEYAILLYQLGRANEGDRQFRELRQIWRDSDHVVQVPERLRWLLAPGCAERLVVNAVTGSDYGSRAMAKVREFGNTNTPFRAEEFGFRELRPGQQITGFVSFGHNGPFLRPVTANLLHN